MREISRLLMMLALVGCKQAPELPAVLAPYKVDIQQGNLVTQEMVAKLRPGMTRAQVRFALGSPLVVDPFRSDRWDYVYMYRKQGKDTQRRRVTVIFEDDRLARIEGDVLPADSMRKPAAGAAAADKPGEPASDATSEKPKDEKGFFGRMLEKIGF